MDLYVDAAGAQIIFLKGKANDDVGANTQKQLRDAQTADLSVTDLSKALRQGKAGKEGVSDKALTDTKAFSAQQWGEFKDPMDYELRLAPQRGDPGTLAARRKQVEAYSSGNANVQKLVNESATRMQKETGAERNTSWLIQQGGNPPG